MKVQTNITKQEAKRERVASRHEKPHRHETSNDFVIQCDHL